MYLHPKYPLRVLFIIGIVILGFIFIGIRVIELSSPSINSKFLPFGEVDPAFLPTISDRNGILIATNLATASLYANPKKVHNIPSTTKQITKVFRDIKYETLKHKLESDNSFVWVKRNLAPQEQIAINKMGIPGLYFKNEFRRVYPQGALVAHILGQVDSFNKGIAGIEYYATKNNLKDPITLTIDIRVQNILKEELNKAIKSYEAIGGAGVIMQAHTGEILALVSLPDYDPNFANNTPSMNKFNRATLGLYELGSVLKLFTIAAALDTRKVTLDTKYDVTAPIKIGKHTIKDTFPTKGELTVTDIIVKSSNIGTSKIATEIGGNTLKKYFEKLGFFSPLKLELPEKSITKMPSNWNEIFTSTISYGYGIAPTLLHTAQALAVLINGGVLVEPHLIQQEKKVGQKVIEASTSDLMRFVMKEAIERGTGKKAAAQGYEIGGKTGSAKKSINGNYKTGKEILSFIGAFPISQPVYVIALMIDEPKSSNRITAGIVVAPIAKEIIEQAASLLNVTPKVD